MKTLKEAPVIVGRFGKNSADNPFAPSRLESQMAIIAGAGERIRRTWQDAPIEGEPSDELPNGVRLRRLDGDIWAINDSAIGFHKDRTAPRHRVLGVVLVNDAGLMLYQDQQVWDLPVGTIYHIDGRRTHGAIERNEVRTGLFGFLAWDVPVTTPLSELLADLLPSLEAYAKGEARVNILPEQAT